MRELEKSYDPVVVEEKWYRFWLEKNYFHADAATHKVPYTIVIPPPNVTGSLHMGHALYVIQDILIRWRRMQGRNALWLPGTDHAGIATQMVVERLLAAREGKTRHQLGREEFLKRVWEWKTKSGGRIIEQLKTLGASCDWQRERFTMDEGLTRAVREAFVRLYEEGLIYRAERLINWCSRCFTALSDLEVEHQELEGHLWHIRYGELVVATTRPETMLGDAAVAVHPEDDRFSKMIGSRVKLPLVDREIPIIGDAILVDREFGTGAVKVTPAHDFNDFEVGQRHQLPLLSILDAQGKINQNAPEKYRGLSVADARKVVLAELQAQGLLVEEKPHALSVGRCQRCDTLVEPTLSVQWFVKAEPLAKPAIEAVEQGETKFVPESWQKTYMHWMNNIKDWCISRQLWWGHRIPVWYCESGHVTVARQDPAACGTCQSTELKQDEDVLDTWFSSALWPFSTLGWPDDTRDLKTFYPSNVMETGYDILFFWVARMMMMGLHFMKKVPFRTVFLHAIVVDEHGDKMSKVKGNVIDPLDVIHGATLEALTKKAEEGLSPKSALDNIKKSFPTGIPAAGTDALRFTLAAQAAQGRNIRLALGRVEGYRHFCNKIWNATRFAMMNLGEFAPDIFADRLAAGALELSLADRWILSRLQRTVQAVDEALENFRFNDAANLIYQFVWSELCDWYIEIIKPTLLSETPARLTVQGCLVHVLETACRLLHPIMPFITEEIWQALPKAEGAPDSIMITLYPSVEMRLVDEMAERQMARLQQAVTAIRSLRAEYNIAPSKKVDVTLQTPDPAALDAERDLIARLCRTENLAIVKEVVPKARTVMTISGDLQVTMDAGVVDVAAETTRIEKEIGKTHKEQEQVTARLSKESFVARAPADVVEKERMRQTELLGKISRLEESLRSLQQLR